MSDPVVVALITGSLALVGVIVTAVASTIHHRKHEKVTTDTHEGMARISDSVARIEVIANGRLETALEQIRELNESNARLEAALAEHLHDPRTKT